MEKECKVNKDWQYTVFWDKYVGCWAGIASNKHYQKTPEVFADTPEMALLNVMFVVERLSEEEDD
jgi:hypothetical protein